MPQVAKEQTSATSSDIIEALVDAGVPTVNSARILAAQSAVETAGWQAMWNWNVGNITAGSPSTQSWVQQATTGPAAPLQFLAFDSLQDGANYFVAFLQKRGVLQCANVGNLDGYVDALRRCNYAGPGADYARYRDGMAAWLKKLGGALPVPGTGKALAYGALLVGGGILALGGLAWAADHGYFTNSRRGVHE
jgi:hypothetical protein